MQLIINFMIALVSFIIGSEMQKMHIIRVIDSITIQVEKEVEQIEKALDEAEDLDK